MASNNIHRYQAGADYAEDHNLQNNIESVNRDVRHDVEPEKASSGHTA